MRTVWPQWPWRPGAQVLSQLPAWALDPGPRLSGVSPVRVVCFPWAAAGHKLCTSIQHTTLLSSPRASQRTRTLLRLSCSWKPSSGHWFLGVRSYLVQDLLIRLDFVCIEKPVSLASNHIMCLMLYMAFTVKVTAEKSLYYCETSSRPRPLLFFFLKSLFL